MQTLFKLTLFKLLIKQAVFSGEKVIFGSLQFTQVALPYNFKSKILYFA